MRTTTAAARQQSRGVIVAKLLQNNMTRMQDRSRRPHHAPPACYDSARFSRIKSHATLICLILASRASRSASSLA